YAHYRPGASTPTPDDIAGICWIYPADGTRTTNAGALPGDACNPIPRDDFSTQCGSVLEGGRGTECSVRRPPGAGGGGAYAPLGLATLVLVARRTRRCSWGRSQRPPEALVLEDLRDGGLSQRTCLQPRSHTAPRVTRPTPQDWACPRR